MPNMITPPHFKKLDEMQGRRILVVEGNDTERYLLVDFLRGLGYRVYQAANGQQGVHKALQVQPDLILMDVHMPVCNGLEACRLLQADQRTHRVPVIFLTAAALPEERVQGLQAGAVDYVTKPFNNEELRLRLAVHLRWRGGRAPSLERPPLDSASALDHILFQSARCQLVSHLAETPDLHQLASTLRTNAKRLNEAFRKCAGVTVFAYLREERMQQAQFMLENTELPVQAIALELGFTSGANFATAFRERFGVSPSQYRQTRTGGEQSSSARPMAARLASASPITDAIAQSAGAHSFASAGYFGE